MRTLVALVWMVLALGCQTHQRAALAARAQLEMVGMAKRDVLVCAGVPDKSVLSEGLEFLTYLRSGNGPLYDADGPTRQKRCEVTVVLDAGKVLRVAYAETQSGPLTKNEQCAFVVGDCVRQNDEAGGQQQTSASN